MNKHQGIILTSLFLLLGTLILIIFATQKPQELRQKAAVPTGSETILLSPPSNTVYVGQSMTINLTTNLTGKTIDGIQVVANISGIIPSNLTYTPATIGKLDILTHGLNPTNTGKRWNVVYRTFDVLKPYTGTGIVSLGTLTFTGTQPGTMTITFDTKLTKIVQNQTTLDLVKPPITGTYIFLPVPTASPVPTNSPIPVPTKEPTATPTKRPPPPPINTPTPIRRPTAIPPTRIVPSPVPPRRPTPPPPRRCIWQWPWRPFPCLIYAM